MLESIRIQRFKSLVDVNVPLRRVNVLIGENGSGKSNLLEAMAFAAAAIGQTSCDREALVSRGVRWTDGERLVSGFVNEPAIGRPSIEVSWPMSGGIGSVQAYLDRTVPNTSTRWLVGRRMPAQSVDDPERILEDAQNSGLLKFVQTRDSVDSPEHRRFLAEMVVSGTKFEQGAAALLPFVIYAPEASVLRNFGEDERAITPLGVRGEGLFRVLHLLSKDADRWASLKEGLQLLGWLEDVELSPDADGFDRSLRLQDRFLPEARRVFDHRSANEAFLPPHQNLWVSHGGSGSFPRV